MSSNNLEMEKKLDILGKIQKSEPSPFLYTRILAAIEKKQKQVVPLKWTVAAALCLIIVLFVNVRAVQVSKTAQADELGAFVSKSQNMLYND